MCLAQEFSVDAQLALAHTRALKAEESLRQVNSGTVTLQSESERERPQPVEVIREAAPRCRLRPHTVGGREFASLGGSPAALTSALDAGLTQFREFTLPGPSREAGAAQ